MEYQVYCVYRKSLKRYNVPFFAFDDASAVEQLQDVALNSPVIVQSLDDLVLYRIGSFDPVCALITDDRPVHILDLIDLPLPDHLRKSVVAMYGLEVTAHE